MPRRPRCRLRLSAESAIYCNSLSTKRGISSVPTRNPVREISLIRPSMMTLVSTKTVLFPDCSFWKIKGVMGARFHCWEQAKSDEMYRKSLVCYKLPWPNFVSKFYEVY